MLDVEFQDTYVNKLQQDYKYVLHKHGISKKVYDKVAFFKHRPDNFPTIRLAQLAILYHTHQNLFSKIMNVNSIDEIYNLFNVEVSIYWESHYNFDKISIQKKKKMSRSFIDLILINTIIPVRFAYEQSLKEEISDEIVDLMKSIHSEKNSIIDKFATIGVHSKNAFDSQSLLQLKKEYCDVKKCLQCAVGLYLLKK